MNLFLETIVLGNPNEYMVITIGNFLGCISLNFLDECRSTAREERKMEKL